MRNSIPSSVVNFIPFSRPFCLCVVLATIVACTPVFVNEATPRPNIDLTRSKDTLALAIHEEVQDSFELPEQNRINRVVVKSWRVTLANGFQNGFSESYTIVSTGADRTIEIRRADLLIIPEKTFVVTSKARSQITYQARLLDKKGNILARSAGTIEAKRVASDAGYASENAADAVETMYERIATDFFGP